MALRPRYASFCVVGVRVTLLGRGPLFSSTCLFLSDFRIGPHCAGGSNKTTRQTGRTVSQVAAGAAGISSTTSKGGKKTTTKNAPPPQPMWVMPLSLMWMNNFRTTGEEMVEWGRAGLWKLTLKEERSRFHVALATAVCRRHRRQTIVTPPAHFRGAPAERKPRAGTANRVPGRSPSAHVSVRAGGTSVKGIPCSPCQSVPAGRPQNAQPRTRHPTSSHFEQPLHLANTAARPVMKDWGPRFEDFVVIVILD